MQHAHIRARPPPPSSIRLTRPLTDLKHPASSDKDTRNNINEPDRKTQKAIPFLGDRQENRLNVVLDKDAWDGVLGNSTRLLRHSVLVREDCVGVPAEEAALFVCGLIVAGRRRARGVYVVDRTSVGRVDGGHDREVVLVLPEVEVGSRQSIVQWVLKRGIEGPER